MRLQGSKSKDALADLPVPDEYVLVPEGTPAGAPYNVAQAYTRFADGFRSGQRVDPDFDRAVQLHKLLAAMEQSSDEGRAVRV